MPMFAVYYVPPADHPLYQIASQMMGYDVRAGTFWPPENPLWTQFSMPVTPEWVAEAQSFGFHVTIGHALAFDAARLDEISREIEQILALFDPQKPFTLTPADPYLRSTGRSMTLYYHANPAFMMFHALIIARVHTLATTSPMADATAAGEYPDLPAFYARRVETYKHITLLDDWFPHLRIFSGCDAPQPEPIQEEMLALLPPPAPLTVESICLLIKNDGASHFHLYHEYYR